MILDVDKQHKAGDDTILNDLDNDWYRLAPIIFMYERDTNRSRNISTQVRRFYFGDKPIGPDSYDGIAHVRITNIVQQIIITKKRSPKNNCTIPGTKRKRK